MTHLHIQVLQISTFSRWRFVQNPHPSLPQQQQQHPFSHSKDLSVGLGLRKKPVGVVGSIYQPPDNVYQITDAVNFLGAAISKMTTPYAKAMAALLGISYIQPFEDGNKRTARLMANALLLAYKCAPLSYRSVDEDEYREAMLVFYEINSIVPFKKIFIGQYEFAAKNYAVK